MTENQVKALLAKIWRRMGAMVLPVHGHSMQEPGWPDLYVAHALWTGWMELKLDTEPLSAKQHHILLGLHSASVNATIGRVTPENAIWVYNVHGVLLFKTFLTDAAGILKGLRDASTQ